MARDTKSLSVNISVIARASGAFNPVDGIGELTEILSDVPRALALPSDPAVGNDENAVASDFSEEVLVSETIT